ncbi:hypothetical protein C8R46DRAFT_1220375 [Mycena filopes]|nr:hypothetical protein C8R46DRAFT_1220375 [Mycena filopes]
MSQTLWVVQLSPEYQELNAEITAIQQAWRRCPPQVRSYKEFVIVARRHRDGPKACVQAIGALRFTVVHPYVLPSWLHWHAISSSLTAVDNFGGHGPKFGLSGPQHIRQRVGSWQLGAYTGEHHPKTPQKKKRRRARLREEQAVLEAFHEHRTQAAEQEYATLQAMYWAEPGE